MNHLPAPFMVGVTGIEPVASSVSGKRAPAAPNARKEVVYQNGTASQEYFCIVPCVWLRVSLEYRFARGSGSVGRAQPCQGWGRGFEPRLPLQAKSGADLIRRLFYSRRRGQVVRQGPAKPSSPVRIRSSPPKISQRPAGALFILEPNKSKSGLLQLDGEGQGACHPRNPHWASSTRALIGAQHKISGCILRQVLSLSD